MTKFLKQNLLVYFLKQSYFRLKIGYGKNVKLEHNVQLNNNVTFEGNNVVFKNTKIRSSHIGYGTYIANGSSIARTKIGKYCAIGDNVSISLGLHPSKDYVSIHPAFFSPNKQAGFTYSNEQLFEEHKYLDNGPYCVEIGNDVWIGNNVLIFDGIKIGNGAIIGAGAIVTKSVPDYSIVTGIPAKHVRYRFTDEQITRLLTIKWWDKEPSWLAENYKLFTNVDEFLNKIKVK